MNEQEIKDLIQQMIDDNNTVDQFAVSQTPFHTHSGADSAQLRFTKLFDVPDSYYTHAGETLIVDPTETQLIFGNSSIAGEVAENGTAVSLPSGWTSTNNSNGHYTVTHTLGTANFIVLLTSAENFVMISNISRSSTNFTVQAVDFNGNYSNTAFTFLVVLK